jgi:hypothetical protein
MTARWLPVLLICVVGMGGCSKKRPSSIETLSPPPASNAPFGYYRANQPDTDGGYDFAEFLPDNQLRIGKRVQQSEIAFTMPYTINGKEVRIHNKATIEIQGVKATVAPVVYFEILDDGTLRTPQGKVFSLAAKPPPVEIARNEPLPPFEVRTNGLGGEVVFRALRASPSAMFGLLSRPRLVPSASTTVYVQGGGKYPGGTLVWTPEKGWTGFPEKDQRAAPIAFLSGIAESGLAVLCTDDGPLTFTPGSDAKSVALPEGTAKTPGKNDRDTRPGEVLGISRDGRVMAGWCKKGDQPGMSDIHAVRWIDGKPELLPELPDANVRSKATCVSADGKVIAGFCSNSTATFPVRWLANGTVERIDDWKDRIFPYSPFALSANGSAVGASSMDRLVRWMPDGKYKLLAINGGGFFQIHAMTADGRVIVGQDSAVPSGIKYAGDVRRPVAWIDDRAPLRVNELLKDTLKMDLGKWNLINVTDISADGRVMVGTGHDEKGNTAVWMLTLPAGWYDALPK